MNVYEMYVEHGKQPGFWLTRTTWGNTIARSKQVGELQGRPPNYGNSEVVVFDLQTGKVVDEHFVSGVGCSRRSGAVKPALTPRLGA